MNGKQNLKKSDRQFIQQGFADRDHAVALELQLNAAPPLHHDLSVSVLAGPHVLGAGRMS
jgi:hypothetical protein